MTGIRNHGKLGVRDDLKGFEGVLKTDKIVISENDENRRFYRSQLIFRKSSPLHVELWEMARPPRLERGTLCLEGRCSIQLSYGRTMDHQRRMSHEYRSAAS